MAEDTPYPAVPPRLGRTASSLHSTQSVERVQMSQAAWVRRAGRFVEQLQRIHDSNGLVAL